VVAVVLDQASTRFAARRLARMAKTAEARFTVAREGKRT